MLSNCNKCKFFDSDSHHSADLRCAVAPAYTSMWQRLKSLDDYSLNCLPIDNCRDFELNPSLETKEISFSLTFPDWQKLARESNPPALIPALESVTFELNLSLTLKQWQQVADSTSIPTVRLQLEAEGIEPQRDPWIQVDSSCIDAIAYLQNESILKIRFNSGAVYQYTNVPETIFLDFCDAASFGSFFNHHIKDCYSYRLIENS